MDEIVIEEVVVRVGNKRLKLTLEQVDGLIKLLTKLRPATA